MTYNFPDIKRGTKYKGLLVQRVLNGNAFNLNHTKIRIEFRYGSMTGPVELCLSDGSGITITDAANGWWQIDPFIVMMPAGQYFYDVKYLDNDGADPESYQEGTWRILQNVTD